MQRPQRADGGRLLPRSGSHRAPPVGFGRRTFTATEDRTMADDIMKLRALLNKNLDDDLLRELIGLTAHRLMELEIGGLTTAAHGNRGPERLDHRNGHRSHVWEIPAQRDGGKRDVH